MDSFSLVLQLCSSSLILCSFAAEIPVLNVSYKPQKISPKSKGTVRMLMHAKIRDSYIHPQFIADVIKPLHIEAIFDQEVFMLFHCGQNIGHAHGYCFFGCLVDYKHNYLSQPTSCPFCA